MYVCKDEKIHCIFNKLKIFHRVAKNLQMDISAIDPASKLKKTARILVAGLVFWVPPGMGLQANDNYLSMLEAEAGDTDAKSGMSAAPVSHEPPVKKHYAKKSDVIHPGLDFEGFEEELDSNYSGSHLLYVKLSSSKRQRVYKSYKEDNRISAIREKIVKLLSSG